ncbi:MAG: hypothetical protein UR29_C0005G0004 [Candidatus Woesebacteria bacterium GW2011_GWC2_33_12]|uniref:Uncharacterized protein n=1 Tax=Candidatus Woesebacteria bacterium GW2011_GWB1_33_22 TaxID=1618566 RepID=A0A0G0CNU4_9BACT|nr:MAG: hypothetical protein UR29_C0005G0004 [Candidatus Woesebacteria bacterium GW2011_GWC2_33_12]KKP42311.1 MAG: hypothetical protein UR33_C0003G0004 [Candidatus Woesebacteria bacterium GW2011_GWA2_33_20]KKP45062.1 MAG: hypothetical protein UR35_C0003G0004 [Candidatus Woesebacteria bacterium GW2011_GWB1_33_22]KKP46938.1 MAG: hypothetical protein UR37_C0003G0004 [Microgenomates group bacterium GW2011_GWC1_33_28]KKP50764.1 MAG: hypothetical protein UR41_C0003G0004 [Candidatus Woesebacteria bact
MSQSKRLWPLCKLKDSGSCQDIAIIPPEVHEDGDLYYWEVSPRIKSCRECGFHRKNCEQC